VDDAAGTKEAVPPVLALRFDDGGLGTGSGGWAPMKDYQAAVEKLRSDAAEAARIRDLATDSTKRGMFDRLRQHFLRLADEVEQAMKSGTQPPWVKRPLVRD
jgi:hypothetical protein